MIDYISQSSMVNVVMYAKHHLRETFLTFTGESNKLSNKNYIYRLFWELYIITGYYAKYPKKINGFGNYS